MKIIKEVSKRGTIYYVNESGQFHREDGPAIEWHNGDKHWYLNNKLITEQEFNDHLLRKRLQKIIEL